MSRVDLDIQSRRLGKGQLLNGSMSNLDLDIQM
jgi:hypothetical protein